MIRRLFSPPVFQEDDKNFRAKFINVFAWSVIAIAVAGMTFASARRSKKLHASSYFSGLIVVMLLALFLLRRGWVGREWDGHYPAQLAGCKHSSVYSRWREGCDCCRLYRPGLAGKYYRQLARGRCCDPEWYCRDLVSCLMQVNNYFVPSSQSPIAFARDLSLVFVAIAVLVYFSAKSMRNAFERATTSEKDLLISNESLKELNQSLENRVAQPYGRIDRCQRAKSSAVPASSKPSQRWRGQPPRLRMRTHSSPASPM